MDMCKSKNILWSDAYKNEVLEYLKSRDHSQEAVKEILPLIMQGPSKSMFREKIDNDTFNKLKEKGIYDRLSCLKDSGVKLPEDIENEYNGIQKKYSIPSSREVNNGQNDLLLSNKGAHWEGSEKRYHRWTDDKIFEDIKYTKPYTYPDITCKKENFRLFIVDFPERAFKILSMFQDDDIHSAPYWSAILDEIPSIKNTQQSDEYFLKSLQRMEDFGDEVITQYLWSLINAWDYKAGSIYDKDKNYFKKWWDKLWKLSIESEASPEKSPLVAEYFFTELSETPPERDLSDFSFEAINSKSGQLSHSIFRILWSKFPEIIPKNDEIPEDIKKYFQIILKQAVNINPSVLFHFGSDLYTLWHLDRKWTIENIKPLMKWEKNQDILTRSENSGSDRREKTAKFKQDQYCRALWSGYLYHIRLNSDFLSDFRSELFHLLLNGRDFHARESNNKIRYCEAIAELFFITTGGKWITNIFTEQETRTLIQSIDIDILESISRQIWVLLKDSKDKAANLWSEKIKLWCQNCWPQLRELRTPETAKNLSLAVLHCGEKLPEAFKLLRDKIEGKILNNNNYIVYHIEKNKEELNYIFNYPEQLLSLLNWSFPEDKIYPDHNKKEVGKILSELKKKDSTITGNQLYKKMFEKTNILTI